MRKLTDNLLQPSLSLLHGISMRPLTLAQIAHMLSVQASPKIVTPTGFCVDTCQLERGQIYVALKGARVDGHAFLEEAQKRGACAALVSQGYTGPHFGLPLISVKDPLEAFQSLARQLCQQSKTRAVAITGSIGKTTTKEFVKQLLSKQYRVAATPGNNNSQIGLPLALLNHTDGTEEILVVEMGMTHPGNIKGLMSIVTPELAVITTTALVHACNFDSLLEITRAKAEILDHLDTKQAFIHRDIEGYDEILQRGPCVKSSFSTTHPAADYRLAMDHERMSIIEKGIAHPVGILNLPGKHNRHNLLAAIAVARYFGVDWNAIRDTIPELQLPERRLQRVLHKGITFINDAYNAAELSVKSALESLPEPGEGGTKIAVLASMMELGKFSEDCHYRVAEHALNYVEKIYCMGLECRPIYDLWTQHGRPVELFMDRNSLVDKLRIDLKPKDVVLLKGARSKELWKVIEEL